MTPAIEQSVRFPCVPEVLFEMYIDSAKHSAATGASSKISRRTGGAFTAFGGCWLEGRYRPCLVLRIQIAHVLPD